jgi:hypothetical protein
VKAATRESELEDMIGTVGQTFLGVTLNCARCHDHKFDPIPQRDYYRVKAVLQGVRHGERPLVTPAEKAALDRARSERQRRVTELNQRLAELDAARRGRVTQTVRGSVNTILAGSVPPPLAKWSFGSEARDDFGALGGTLHGGARVESGRLLLDGKEACVITEPLRAPLAEKTLEAWVSLSSLDQGGGGVISVETTNGDRFDSLVFGERLARRWMAGSESYRRSRDFPEAPEESGQTGRIPCMWPGLLDPTAPSRSFATDAPMVLPTGRRTAQPASEREKRACSWAGVTPAAAAPISRAKSRRHAFTIAR